MTFDLDLGSETFSLPGCDLDLTLHASAVIVTPPGTWSPWSTEAFRKELTAGNLWVDSSATFQLHLYIAFEPESDFCGTHSKFMSRLGDMLCTSKFWSELDFEISFEGDNYDSLLEHFPPNCHLSFSFRKSTRRPTASKASKIPTALQSSPDAPSIDIVPTVFLSTINARLEYARSGQHTHQLLQSSCSTRETTPNLTSRTLFTSLETPFVPQIPTSFVQFEPIHMPTDKLQYAEEQWEAFHCLIPEPDLFPVPNQLVSTQELSTLLNTALTALVAGQPPTRKGHLKTQEPSAQTLVRLSQIAPSIFSPGYRNSVNQRAQFIPSIAKSITSIIKHSRDPNLQDKAIKFQCLGESETDAEVSNAPANTATISLNSRLKASLWRVAANQINPTQGVRKHSPPVLLPEVGTRSEDELSFEDEIRFSASPTEENPFIRGSGSSEDGGLDGYLGTEDECSILGATESGSILTMEEELSDHSVDLFSFHDSETDLVSRQSKSTSISGVSMYQTPQYSSHNFLEGLGYLGSPLLLSDGSASLDDQEVCDNMLCE